MSREDRIIKILHEDLQPDQLKVDNNSYLHKGHLGDDGTLETHYKVTVESNKLKGVSRVEAHKAVKRALKEEFDSGLHALEIKIVR